MIDLAGLPDSANQFWALIPVEVWVGGFGGDEGRGPSVRGTGKGAGFLKNLGGAKICAASIANPL